MIEKKSEEGRLYKQSEMKSVTVDFVMMSLKVG